MRGFQALALSCLLVCGVAANGCRTPVVTEPEPEQSERPSEPSRPATVEAKGDGPCRAGERLAQLDLGASWQLDFSPDGSVLVTHGYGEAPRAWDGWTFELLGSLPDPSGASMIFVGERGFLVPTKTGAHLYDIVTEDRLAVFGHETSLVGAQASPSGKYVLTTVRTDDEFAPYQATVWEVASEAPLATILNVRYLGPIAITDAEDRMVAINKLGELRAYEFPSGRELGPVLANAGLERISDYVFLPGGRRLVVETGDGRLAIGGLDDGELTVGEIPKAEGLASPPGLATTGDGRRVAGLVDDAQGWIWDTEAQRLLATFSAGEFPRALTAMTWTEDGRLFVGGDLGTLRQWELDSGAELPQLGAVSTKVLALAASPDGTRLAVGHEEGVVVWCIATDGL